MSVTVKLRFVRHSAKKLRPYARFFAGKPLEAAINQATLMPQDSARYIHKALLMARSAAEAKEFQPEELVIAAIMATDGPKIRRVRPNARGRSNAYKKHLAHLTVSVDLPKESKKKPTAKRAPKAKAVAETKESK